MNYYFITENMIFLIIIFCNYTLNVIKNKFITMKNIFAKIMYLKRKINVMIYSVSIS